MTHQHPAFPLSVSRVFNRMSQLLSIVLGYMFYKTALLLLAMDRHCFFRDDMCDGCGQKMLRVEKPNFVQMGSGLPPVTRQLTVKYLQYVCHALSDSVTFLVSFLRSLENVKKRKTQRRTHKTDELFLKFDIFFIFNLYT